MKKSFDEDLYLKLNPDLADAKRTGQIENLEEHWMKTGIHEERAGIRPTINRYYTDNRDRMAITPFDKDHFNPLSYLAMYPDLSAVYKDDLNAAYSHWKSYGWQEGRRGEYLAPAPRQMNITRFKKKAFGVNFFAPLSTQSGLGSAARGYLAALRAASIPVCIINYRYQNQKFEFRKEDVPRESPFKINLIQVNAIGMPQFTEAFGGEIYNDCYNIAIWAWELAVFRPEWLGAFANLDEVWALSSFNARAIAAVSPIPVFTIAPPVVEEQKLSVDGGCYRQALDIPKESFLFICVFDAASQIERKNPLAALQAFLRIFNQKDEAHIIFKFHSSSNDLHGIQELQDAADKNCNVHLVERLLSPSELRDLIEETDCLVSPHRSEGLGLNLAEYMLLGKPVIATSYSGNLDFMSTWNSFLIPFRFKAIEQDLFPYPRGYFWAEPDVGKLSITMKQVAQNHLRSRIKTKLAKIHIKRKLSTAAVSRKMLRRFKNLGFDKNIPTYAKSFINRISVPAPFVESDLIDNSMATSFTVFAYAQEQNNEHALSLFKSIKRQSYARWDFVLGRRRKSRTEGSNGLEDFRGFEAKFRLLEFQYVRDGIPSVEAALEVTTGRWLVFCPDVHPNTSINLSYINEMIRKYPTSSLFSTELIDDAEVIRVKNLFGHDGCIRIHQGTEHCRGIFYVIKTSTSLY